MNRRVYYLQLTTATKNAQKTCSFYELLDKLEDVPPSVIDLLRLSRSGMEVFDGCQRKLLKALTRNGTLRKRVELLMTIPAVGEVTALTWALEIGDPHRFSTVNKAVSYCGLCSAQRESAGKKTHEVRYQKTATNTCKGYS